MSRAVRFSFFAALILFTPSLLLAQINTGTIAGVVKDSSGGARPGASVKVTRDGAERAIDLFTGGGNTGLIVGQPGDRRTAGVTLRFALKTN